MKAHLLIFSLLVSQNAFASFSVSWLKCASADGTMVLSDRHERRWDGYRLDQTVATVKGHDLIVQEFTFDEAARTIISDETEHRPNPERPMVSTRKVISVEKMRVLGAERIPNPLNHQPPALPVNWSGQVLCERINSAGL